MTPEATLTQPNVLPTHEAVIEQDAFALGAASLDAVGFEFSDADLQFLSEAGINSASLTGDLSAEENARLEAQDVASAQAAQDYFARQDAAMVTAAHAQAAQTKARHDFQHNVLDADALAAEASKKKKKDFALAA